MAVSGRSAPTAFHADQTVGLGDDLQVGLGAGPSLCLVRRLVGRGGVAVRVVPLDQLQVPLAYGGPIVAAIVALVFASKAKKEIEQSGGWQTGSGFVTAAKIIAWINIAFMIVVLIFYVILIAFVISNPGVVDTYPTYTPYNG